MSSEEKLYTSTWRSEGSVELLRPFLSPQWTPDLRTPREVDPYSYSEVDEVGGVWGSTMNFISVISR